MSGGDSAPWPNVRLKWLSRIFAGGTPDSADPSLWLDGVATDGVPWVAIGDMSRRDVVMSTAKSVTVPAIESKNLPVGGPGTVLLAMYASVGEVSTLSVRATWNQALVGFAPDSGRLEGRFLAHALRAARPTLLSEVRSNTQDNLNASQVGATKIPIPPMAEQRAIADFLDEQTSRIDTLIGKQTQLIDTLRERRDAVITAATNPPDAKRVPLKRITRPITDGAHISPDTINGKHDFVSTRDIKNGSIDFDGSLKTSDESFAYMVQTGCRPSRGDILFAKDGTVGTTAVVLSDHPFVVASSLVIISVRPSRASSRFVEYALRAAPTRHQATAFMRGAGLPRISVANVGRLEISLPPLGAQEKIAAYLDQQTTRIDALIAKTEEHIGLARERRAALITAAVTGRIDVRTAWRAATVGA
ncbi:restriction modification system S chain-like protein [Paraoerskovia sediminicola]|uniref:Restriction modification system S chain-like protein n=1 Tax=Paraoerskovia sediminicola TaxID=1138587 RepID=A0ABN6XC49_9CELL|nr:restriction endonuclease subunit S [Paraoerskovia sediminicola]BDZ42454.1 restriction modification system S chain-like protein [Paraoerskovia sediminicola]